MSTEQKLAAAFTLHQSGNLAAAEIAYKDVLNGDSQQPNALFMLGILFSDKGRFDQAEDMLNRLLQLQPNHAMALHSLGRLRQQQENHSAAVDLFAQAAQARPGFAPILNDWAVSLTRLGQRQPALDLLDQALSLDNDYAVAHDNRGLVLFDLRLFDQSALAHLAALARTSPDDTDNRISILLHLAQAAAESHEYAASERAYRAVLAVSPHHVDALDHLAKVLERQLRHGEALELRNILSRSRGLVTSGTSHGPQARILVVGGVGAGHVPTRYLFDPAHFSTLSFNMLSPDQPDAPLGGIGFDQLACCDVVFNTLGEVEQDGGQLPALNDLLNRLGKPVLNPPPHVARTGRDNVQALFGDIPGLVVPQVRRASRAEVAALTGSKPVLVRPHGAHGGKDLALIDSPEAAEDYLKTVAYDGFLITDFYNFRGANDSWRKYRFIFVDRVPYAYHLAIADEWLVHYWRAEMGCNPWKKAEEEIFLTDWTSVFGPLGSEAVRQVGQRLDLDYGGMDCSILPDGRVLFFEANACMLMHLDDPAAEFPYKHVAVPRIRDAVTRMVLARK